MSTTTPLSKLDGPCRQFAQALGQSRLLTVEQLEEAVGELSRGKGKSHAIAVATELVERNWISRWQAEQLLAGRTAFCLGKYKLLEKIGSGGMGAVYKAEQMGFGRIVALKLMGQELLQKPGALDRFLREIQLIAKLQHPNIVSAFDADQVAGHHFLILEYVEGQDLEQILLQTGKLPIGTACEAIQQAAAGLQHAFERGIVHRDIKPGNLLVTKAAAGRFIVKILDMGLARFTRSHDDAALTKSGQIMGTPDYMAPEQVEDTRKVDTRADIYSLGSSLFEMLTGRVPFEGGTATRRLMARLAGEAPRLRQAAPDMPEALERVIARMLARQPEGRYATPGEVVAALAPFVEMQSAGLVTTSQGEKAASLAVTTDLSKMSLGDLAASLSQTSTAIALQAAPDQTLDEFGSLLQNLSSTSAETTLGHALAERQAEESRNWRWKAWTAIAVVAAAAAILVWYEAGAAQLTIEIPPAERTGVLEIDGKLKEMPKQSVVMWTGRPGKVNIRVTRSGYEPAVKDLAFARGDKLVFRPEWKPLPETARALTWDALAAEAVALRPLAALDPKLTDFRNRVLQEKADQAGSPQTLRALAILKTLRNPLDGYRISDISPQSLDIPIADDAPFAAVFGATEVDRRLWRSPLPIQFASDGKRVLVATTGLTRVYDVGNRTSQTFYFYPTFNAAIHPDGQTFIIGGSGRAAVHSMLNGEHLFSIPAPSYMYAVQFSPDGRRVVTGGAVGDIRIWEIDGASPRQLPISIPIQKRELRNVAFSPDGNTILAQTETEAIVRQFDAMTGAEIRQFPTHNSHINRFNVSSKGLLATGSTDQKARLWNLADGKLVREIGGESIRVANAAFSPDGRYLATGGAGGDHAFRIWDVQTGTLVATGNGHTDVVSAIGFSPDNRQIVSSGSDCTVRFWSFDNQRLQPVRAAIHPWLIKPTVSADGRMIAAGAMNGEILVWDAPSREPRSLSPPLPRIFALEFAPAGNQLATAHYDHRIRLWNSSTGELLRTLEGHDGYVTVLAYSADGRRLASSATDNAVRIWKLDTGEAELVLPGGKAPIVSLAWRPDGKLLASGDRDHVLRLWDANTGSDRGTRTFTLGTISTLSFTPGGESLIFPNYNDVRRWRYGGGADDIVTGLSQNIGVVHPFQNSEKVALAAVDGRLRVARTEVSSSGIRAPEREWVYGCYYSGLDKISSTADGRYLLTANQNGTAFLFRVGGDINRP